MRQFIFSSCVLFTFLLQGCQKDDEVVPPIQPEEDFSEMTDPRDGQTYKTCKIGDQVWMAENLNYYTPAGSWYYDNDSAKYSTPYGRLYLWNIAMANHPSSNLSPSGVQGICPPGWHIPSYDEWKELQMYLANNGLTTHDLMESGTSHWPTGGTNKTQFNAVAAGTVYNDGKSYAHINIRTTYLTSTIDSNTGGAWGFGLDQNGPMTVNPLGLQNGWSVRCVKDE